MDLTILFLSMSFEGPLVCTCVGETADGNLQLRPPYVVSDGWHRGAAWVLHQQANRLYPIGVRVIATERAVPLLGQAWRLVSRAPQ